MSRPDLAAVPLEERCRWARVLIAQGTGASLEDRMALVEAAIWPTPRIGIPAPESTQRDRGASLGREIGLFTHQSPNTPAMAPAAELELGEPGEQLCLFDGVMV
jgi:hypothetical protein